MSNADSSKLDCRHCRYYRPEGRRGGSCQLLCVSVRGIWPACSLVVPSFAPSWEAPQENRSRQPPLLQSQRLPQAMSPSEICS